MRDRGWLALRFSPCAALRSCGRLDEHWCRARSATCDFPQACSCAVFCVCWHRVWSSFNTQLSFPAQFLPIACRLLPRHRVLPHQRLVGSKSFKGAAQVAQADMLDVVQQRTDLRQLLQLMYADTGDGGTHDSGGSGSGSNRDVGGSENTRSEADSSGGNSSNRSSRGSDNSGDGVDSSAAVAWRAAAGRPALEQGQTRGVVTMAAESLSQVTTLHSWHLCSCSSVACTQRVHIVSPSMHCHRHAEMDQAACIHAN